jgi:hypothetical protein
MPPMRIAGTRTDAEWHALKAKLVQQPTDAALWNQAFEEFYMTRIDTRYLKPINAIEGLKTDNGEGFAIATLFCSLIEFLEACEQGLIYVWPNPDTNNKEYKDSGPVFRAFFLRTPFNTLVDPALRDGVWRGLRCGLLHEAQTKGGWYLSTEPSGGKLVEQKAGKIVLFRNELRPAFEKYFADYRTRLLSSPDTQAAFIRKWEHLCQP